VVPDPGILHFLGCVCGDVQGGFLVELGHEDAIGNIPSVAFGPRGHAKFIAGGIHCHNDGRVRDW